MSIGDGAPSRPENLEVLGDVDERRSENHGEQSGEDAEHHRDQHLHRRLLGPLLGQLAPLDAHEVRMRPQRVGNAGAEAVRLDQHGHQLTQLRLSRPLRQVVQRRAAASNQSQSSSWTLSAPLDSEAFGP